MINCKTRNGIPPTVRTSLWSVGLLGLLFLGFRAVWKPLPHPPNVKDIATAKRLIVGVWRQTIYDNDVAGSKRKWESRKIAEQRQPPRLLNDPIYYRRFYPDGRLKQRIGLLRWDNKAQQHIVHRPKKSTWNTKVDGKFILGTNADEKYEFLNRENSWFTVRVVNTVVTDPRTVPGEMVPELRRIEYICVTPTMLSISRDRGKTWSSWHRVPKF